MEVVKKLWRSPEEIEPIILDNEDDWLAYRCGKITASDVWKLMKNGQAKNEVFSDTGKTYILQNIAEIITGDQKKIGDAKALAWGKKYEPEAVARAYDEGHIFDYFGGETRIFYPYNAYSGASPDGLSPDTIYEVKCPYTSEKHVENLIGSVDDNPVGFLYRYRFEYLMQIYFNMLCTGRKKGVFISYDPRAVKEEHRLVVIDVVPDEKIITLMDERIELAKDIIKTKLKLIRSIKKRV